ncbi:MAG: DUF3253 domain-containing protein [Verrucomicrobiota bacterium]
MEVSILELLTARDFGKTICPSEAARAVFDAETWRAKMALVREVIVELAASGRIEVCQKGKVVEPSRVSGPIRLRLK